MKVILDNFNFYFSESGEKDKLILSLSGYSENLSKLPIISKLGYETESIFSILNKVAELYGSLSQIPKSPQSLLCILEVIGKLVKMLIQKHRPYNILELGAEQGLLSYFLTYIASEFNEENMVHCVSNTLLNQGWLLFLQEYGNAADSLNLHITSPQTLSLQENYFDFCVMNNSENFPNSGDVLNNAIRLLAPGGLLVFVSADGKVIEQKISLEEKQAAQQTQTKETNIALAQQQIEKQLANLKNLSKEELRQLIKDLSCLEKLAIKYFATEDIDLKNKLNKAKENALNALFKI
ncbi:MAG: class I SAM-dependent methyltransferase [Fibromonadales bacterium]|nr:class I SAM-dependent methyltransferase [Fibromonadales bacterium]